MKKLFALILLVSMFFFFGCPEEKEEDYKSTLTVNNLPGSDSSAAVYSTSISKETIKDNYFFGDYKAHATGTSPFTLVWMDSVSSGTFYVAVETWFSDYSKKRKITTAEFDEKGNATVDWDDMVDL